MESFHETQGQVHGKNNNNNTEQSIDYDFYSKENTLSHGIEKMAIEMSSSSEDTVSFNSEKLIGDDDDDYDEMNAHCVKKIQNSCLAAIRKQSTILKYTILVAFLVGYTVYFIAAIRYNLELALMLIYLTSLTLFCILYVFIRNTFGSQINTYMFVPLTKWKNENWHWLRWLIYPSLVVALILYLCIAVIREVKQLQSLSGIVVFILGVYITSVHPTKINWKPVIWGYALQFIMAIFVLRWEPGYIFVKFLGDEITKFINYAYDGAATVYGDPFLVFHPFTFMGMSMLIYMGAVTSVMYYCGITQLLAGKMAWLMQVTMETTAIETLGVASNIFLNGMDTMLMLRNYLDRMTKSEFHCFQVGAHSTIAGFVFGLFVLFGAPPQHLISAAVMSAPAVIAISKLNYPETKQSITKRQEDVHMATGQETNVFEACANGAAVAGKTVAAVVVNYIAFMGLLAWLNATLAWLGERVGVPQLSFELICSYVFWPLALLIGIDVQDCRVIAKVIGIKLCTTELLAFQTLGQDFRNGLISERSRSIGTYALCGFSSVSTLAIAVGVWQAICPHRTALMASLMLRVLINANIACFMTACISGLMYREDLVIKIDNEEIPGWIAAVLGWLPSYKDLMALVGM